MRYPAEFYSPSSSPYLDELRYPFHDRTITVNHCGRICFGRRKINLSSPFRELNQYDEAGGSLDKRGDECPAGTFHQVALPVSRHGPVLNLCRPLADGDGTEDAFPRAAIYCMMRATDPPLRAQLPKQLPFFGAPRA